MPHNIDNTLTPTATVGPEWAGERLDRALAALGPGLSRGTVQRLIREGRVWCNDQVVTGQDDRVRSGDRLTWSIPPPTPARAVAEALPLTVVYEDAAVIVVDKAAGMTVHPAPGHERGTLVNALLHHCAELSDPVGWSGVGGEQRPGIVHRLDKETSGLLVAAKNDQAHLALAAQFERHTASREYLAIVRGHPATVGRVEAPIGRHPQHRQKMAVTPGKGRLAITHYQVVERLPLSTLLSCRLETGRTHQIRVHLAHLGHALLGDPVYGRPFQPPLGWPEAIRQVVIGFRRQALHAAALQFDHPLDGRRLTFRSPLPPDFVALLEALREALPG